MTADAAEIVRLAEEAVSDLLPFTSHSIGCAIYQRSWVYGEPPCTCGLDDARASAAAIRARAAQYDREVR